MLRHRQITACLLVLITLLMLSLVLAGCDRGKPTPPPTPEAMASAATPAVTILKNPNKSEVPVGGQVALAVEATEVNLKITWHPKRGKVSNAEGPSTIYVAPATPGIDTVDVTVTSDSGSTNKTVTFEVFVPLTEAPAPTNTPTVTPALTKTPISGPANIPPINTGSPTAPTKAGTPTLTTTVRSVPPSTRMGTWLVRALEGCDNSYSLKIDDQTVGQGKVGVKTVAGAGTYDIVLHSDLGSDPIKRGIVIREEDETVVDFTQELGIFVLTSYPQLKKSLTYRPYPPGSEWYGRETLSLPPSQTSFLPGQFGGTYYARLRWKAGEQHCVSPGMYKVVIIPGGFSSHLIGPTDFIRYALFPTEVEFDVEIKGGEKTIVGPETLQLGLLSFDKEGIELAARITDLQTGDELGHFVGLTSDNKYWIFAGTYEVVITTPYPGLTFENVEIKAGEETVLELPDEHSP